MKKTQAVILFLTVFSLTLSACGQKVSTWQEQYDLGVRYLEDGNYEEAIIAFAAAIVIDPKQPDTYLKSAEAYLALNDADSAIAILEQGYGATEDSRLTAELEQLQNLIDNYSVYFTEDMITEEEFTIGGVPFYNLTIEEARNLLPSYDDSHDMEIRDSVGEINLRDYTVYWNHKGVINCQQFMNDSTLYSLAYTDYYDEEIYGVATEIRGISTGDPMEVVLEKIGVTLAGAKIIAESSRNMIIIGVASDVDGGYGWIEVFDSEEPDFVDNIETRTVEIDFGKIICDMSFINNLLVTVYVWVAR